MLTDVFCPSSNHSRVQMGILAPHPSVRGFHRQPDRHRESLASPINEMQERLTHSTHAQTPKKVPGCVKKIDLIPA